MPMEHSKISVAAFGPGDQAQIPKGLLLSIQVHICVKQIIQAYDQATPILIPSDGEVPCRYR